MARVLLIYPKTGFDIGAGVTPPFSVLAIAAELKRKGYTVRIIDQRTDKKWKNTLAREVKKGPVCIGISTMTGQQIKFALQHAAVARTVDPEIPLVWGGVHPSIIPKQTLKSKYVDFVVRGEGEITFCELIEFLEGKRKSLKGIKGLSFVKNGKIVHNLPRPFLDMNNLAPTPWELVNVEDYIHKGVVVKDSKRELDIGETSRGCPYNCGFCYNVLFNKCKWRSLSAENAVKKILEHKEKFKLDVVWLRDDNYFVDRKRAVEISKRLIEEKVDLIWYTSGIRVNLFHAMSDGEIKTLSKSGCEGFRFGIESGNQRVLDLINKGIKIREVYDVNKRAKKLDVAPHYSFMAGFPSETIDEVYDTLAMMEKLKKDNKNAKIHVINMFTPYPGSKLFELAVSEGLKTPKTLKGWSKFHHLSNFAVHLNDKERKILQNIGDVSYFTSEAMLSALPKSMQILFKPVEAWLNFRKKYRMLKFMPEIMVLKRIRNKITGIS